LPKRSLDGVFVRYVRSSSLISTAERYQCRCADLSQFCQKSAISNSDRATRARDL